MKMSPETVDLLMAFAGLLLIAAGAALIYPPAGLIVVGAGLLYFGAWHDLIIALILHRKQTG